MIEGMGDKAAAKKTMQKAGVPTIPGSDGLIKDFERMSKLASDIVGYPIMLKATAGGGGKGMRLVWKEEDLEVHGIVQDKKQKRHLEMMECIWKNSSKIQDI